MGQLLLFSAAAVLCSSCAVGPDYVRPTVTAPAAYKEAGDWAHATPADAQEKGDWWTLFNDPVLNDLQQQVAISNQTIAAASAAYEQARALLREQRAAIFPSVDLSAGATRSNRAGSNVNTTTIGNTYKVDIGASWELDVWGRIRRSVENARASAAASAADLANARLSAQGELASSYWQLRETDAEIGIVKATVEAYQRNLQITQNRYDARIAAKTDVLQAQTQLTTTQATLAGLETRRAQLEHAIAVLVGQPPSAFAIAPAEWNPTIPMIPAAVPSALLQRRPDIAAAERRVAAANASIGVQTAAYFPTLDFTGSAGSSADAISKLFNTATNVWSLGLAATESLFDAGARRAAVAASRAAYQGTVANYRQTVLKAFQDVEDQLIALSVLERQYDLRKQASIAADEAEQLTINQYRAGLISYTDVVTIQATALSARTTLAQAVRDRQTTTVALIQALGGGWSSDSK
jgi:NodT family efflux transporter outer membrane factor (OMF) lipoprotein